MPLEIIIYRILRNTVFLYDKQEYLDCCYSGGNVCFFSRVWGGTDLLSNQERREEVGGRVKRVSILLVLISCLAGLLSACGGGSGGSSESVAQLPLASPLDTWHLRNPLPQGNDLTGVTYGNGIFVAVGEYGTILTSPDGVSWTARSSGTGHGLNGITYGNGLYVAVGDDTVVTSPDSVNWTVSSADVPALGFSQITYGNGIFVLVGGTTFSYVFVSDGAIWTSAGSYQYTFFKITYANGVFWAIKVIYSLHGHIPPLQSIVTSTDGITWTPVWESNVVDWPHNISKLTYVSNLFFAVGRDGTIVTSPDGVIWTEQTSGAVEWLNDLTYGSGIFTAVGGNGKILTSSDGINWTTRTTQVFGQNLSGVAYGNGTFVAVGSNGIILQSDPL